MAAMLKLKVLSNVECFKTFDQWVALAMDATIYYLSIPRDTGLGSKVEKGKVLLLRKYNIKPWKGEGDEPRECVWVTSQTKIFTCKAFDMSPECLKAETPYIKPPKKSIPEVLLSPQKKRLAVRGRVMSVSGEVSGIGRGNSPYKRRRALLQDLDSQTQLELTAWDRNTQLLDKLQPGSDVTIHHVLTEHFNGSVSVKATSSMEVEIEDEDEDVPVTRDQVIVGIMDGVSQEEDEWEIALEDGKCFRTSCDVSEEMLGRKVKLTITNFRVEEIELQ